MTDPEVNANEDQVWVSIDVAVAPTEAFRCFTEEINRWWLSGKIHRTSEHSELFIDSK